MKKLSKEDKRYMTLLIFLSIICAVLLALFIVLTIHGSIFSVFWGCIAAYFGCVCSDKAQQIYDESKKNE